MRKIHHLAIGFQERFVLDPNLGQVKRREEVVKPSDTHQITFDGVTYDVQPDLTFEVPENVAEFYLKRSALGWRDGPNPFYEEYADVIPETPFGTTKSRPRTRKKAG